MDNIKDIKKGDKLLMQIISNGTVFEQHVSYCYELDGVLCFCWNYTLATLKESIGVTFTILDDVKDRELIQKNIKSRNGNLPSWGSGFKHTISASQFDNDGKFTEDINQEFCRCYRNRKK